MFYFIMILWLLSCAVTVISAIQWAVYRSKNKDARGKRKLVIYSLIAVIIFPIIGVSINDSENVVTPITSPVVIKKSIPFVVDASQFSRIKASEVKSILGKPEGEEKWKFNTYDALTLTYENGDYEFLVIDDSVVRFTYAGDEKFEDENDLFEMFGIKPRESNTKVADTGVILNYHSVADNVGEVYVMRDVNDKNKIDTVRITYNLNYFE